MGNTVKFVFEGQEFRTVVFNSQVLVWPAQQAAFLSVSQDLLNNVSSAPSVNLHPWVLRMSPRQARDLGKQAAYLAWQAA